MCSYWIPIIEGAAPVNRIQDPPARVPAQYDILSPISPEEVLTCLPSADTSPGPDGFPVRLWRRIPIPLLAGLFNLINASGELPHELSASRTIFVPKKGDPSCPENYRPISIASVALRHYHRILARRLESLSIVDTRQRAFRRADGVAENIFLLHSLLRDARSSCKGLCLASLDLSKAFDSVAHESIYAALRGAGLCPRFVDYLRGLYLQSGTFIQAGGQCSRALSVLKGVRQGDPLSPLLFNVVVDQALRALPHAVGYALGSEQVSALAFADDVILVASTPLGLQRSCEAFTDRVAVDGLRLNPAKSATLTQIPSGRDHKLKVVDTVYVLNGEPVPALSVSSLWRYLGVGFAGGRLEEYDCASYASAIGRLSAAPMKPQMRLAILRDHLIPMFVHGLTFGAVSAGKLRTLSHETRRAARSWLDLPISCPNAYIHSPTSAGGLGIPSLEHIIPKSRLKRYVRLEQSSVPAVREAFRLHGSKALAASRRAVEKMQLKQSFQTSLHSSVDGCELRMCPDEPASVAFLRNHTGIPGKDFKRYAQLRINGLPSRKRVNRGRRGPTNCRACGAPSETLAHIVQSCHRTNEGRILRHDCLVKKVVAGLSEKGYKVETEFHYRLQGGNLRREPKEPNPDIVATGCDDNRGRFSVICDVQVVSANNTLGWHQNKIRKYADRPDLLSAIRARHHSTNVQTVALTINWRGFSGCTPWCLRDGYSKSPACRWGCRKVLSESDSPTHPCIALGLKGGQKVLLESDPFHIREARMERPRRLRANGFGACCRIVCHMLPESPRGGLAPSRGLYGKIDPHFRAN
ncbi:Reverse transcriptase domain [Cinara cedri]|uniref:Reverse transcriptase domain n=1 Tax=Cinara cedri TaxID=506608 RepID=A0A5E4M9I8_9HEMI|nr:Reverse transcriptase domain [Cinara cedri]